MNPQELRIGNIIREIGPEGEQFVLRVESIIKLGDPGHEDQMEYYVNEAYTMDMLEGIPLDEGWLKRLGGKDLGDNVWQFGDALYVWDSLNNEIECGEICVDTVHKFQTLHFLSTWKELTLSSNTEEK